jgi:hypothetical protein
MLNELLVNFGIERSYVFDVMTQDISTSECLLDLIDNSIDAARRDISSKCQPSISKGLPESYDGYFINLNISPEKIEIIDNCQGMEQQLLAEKAFKLGSRHRQNYSIGIYGVGLIRAFWKMGNEGSLITDNGKEMFHLNFSKSEIDKNENSLLPADIKVTTGSRRNHLLIQDLTNEAFLDCNDSGWISLLRVKISRVFGLCIRKGLVIKINEVLVPEFGPKIRKDLEDLYFPRTWNTSNGVLVKVEAGVHENYLFTGERNHSADKNKLLTKDFGWYVACNDRIVLIADMSPRVGWNNVWHSEYNGFLGWAHFISSDAKLLPWNSRKTDISLEKTAQREVAPELKKFADHYRRANRSFRYKPSPNAKEGNIAPDEISSKTNFSKNLSNEHENRSHKARKRKNLDDSLHQKQGKGMFSKNSDHNETWEYLFPEVSVCHNDNKLKALIIEAQSLPIARPYAATMLFRVAIEGIINTYIEKSALYNTVKLSIFNGFEISGRPYAEDKKRNYAPQLNDLVSWICSNDSFFPEEYFREYKESINSLKNHLPYINKVVHEGQLTSSSKITIVRDDCWPLIKYMLENDPQRKR